MSDPTIRRRPAPRRATTDDAESATPGSPVGSPLTIVLAVDRRGRRLPHPPLDRRRRRRRRRPARDGTGARPRCRPSGSTTARRRIDPDDGPPTTTTGDAVTEGRRRRRQRQRHRRLGGSDDDGAEVEGYEGVGRGRQRDRRATSTPRSSTTSRRAGRPGRGPVGRRDLGGVTASRCRAIPADGGGVHRRRDRARDARHRRRRQVAVRPRGRHDRDERPVGRCRASADQRRRRPAIGADIARRGAAACSMHRAARSRTVGARRTARPAITTATPGRAPTAARRVGVADDDDDRARPRRRGRTRRRRPCRRGSGRRGSPRR